MSWVDCGPMGLRNELRGGIVATVGRRVRAAVSWSLSHSDSRLVTRGQSATIAAAKSDALAAASAAAPSGATLDATVTTSARLG